MTTISRSTSTLILVSFVSLGIPRIHTNFLVILFKGSHVLPCFGKFSLFHTFSYIPVNKSSLSIHEIKLMVQSSPGFSNSSSIGQHAHSTLNLSEITARNNCRRLIIDANLETSWTPVYELQDLLLLIV